MNERQQDQAIEEMERRLRILLSNTRFMLRQSRTRQNPYRVKEYMEEEELYRSLLRLHLIVHSIEKPL